MTRINRFSIAAVLASVFFFALARPAQQKTQKISSRNRAYDVSREASLQGTVVSYTGASPTPPLGARLVLQTSSGLVDVHLGNPKLLEAGHFSLSAGEDVRVLGENVSLGTYTQFVARVVQKGNQSLVLRSPRGFPLIPMVKGAGKAPNGQAGVL